MSLDHIMPDEAARRMNEEGYVYIDVRSIPEFEQNHPDPAVNIPILHADLRTGQMIPNPDFLHVVQANYATDVKLVMGCRSGQRSARAAEVLLQNGYETVVNMQCGFEGERDPFGQVVNPGWAEMGLPTCEENSEGVSYDSLAAKAGL
ncbi:MAG TPA: rhodanese-like domain-containing protein, partial [Candidatus Latescibacteria bacterium]|nr:rhodanese-like domain-containing protein [Candidatus Latescibacterota bacterium]